LSRGLADVVLNNPLDPVEYLAEWLLRQVDTTKRIAVDTTAEAAAKARDAEAEQNGGDPDRRLQVWILDDNSDSSARYRSTATTSGGKDCMIAVLCCGWEVETNCTGCARCPCSIENRPRRGDERRGESEKKATQTERPPEA
jgi:hypothetical protein